MANDFGKQFRNGITKLQVDITKNLNQVAFDLFTNIIHGSSFDVPGTPIDKGELINNWFPAVGDSPDFSTTEELDISGLGSINRVISLIESNPFVDGDNTITLTNSLPYAYKIEYEGHSGQAPAGMVRVAVQDMKNKLESK